MEKDKCIKCCLPVYPKGGGVKINKKTGRCNYCEFYINNDLELFNYKKNKELFEKRLESIRGKYEYDVLVGISGGKDGAYVLHKMVRDYKLKVMAITVNNGFFNEEMKKDIDKLKKIYNFDHIYYNCENYRDLYRGLLALNIPVCIGCGLVGFAAVSNYAYRKKIPFIVNGRASEQMLRFLDEKSYQKSPFYEIVKPNLKEYDREYIFSIYNKLHKFVRKMIMFIPLKRSEKQRVNKEILDPIKEIKRDFVPEHYSYFLTEEYNEKDVRDALAKVGYVAPSTHKDCLIHNANAYAHKFSNMLPIDVYEEATQLRRGKIDKEKFEELLKIRQQEVDNPSEETRNELEMLKKAINISHIGRNSLLKIVYLWVKSKFL